jgi:hypothetical protein
MTLVPDFFADSGQEHMKLIAQYQSGETRAVWVWGKRRLIRENFPQSKRY